MKTKTKAAGLLAAPKARIDRTQLVNMLDHLDLTHRAAAQLFCTDERTIRRWVAGQTSVPPLAVILLRMLMKGFITPTDVLKHQVAR